MPTSLDVSYLSERLAMQPLSDRIFNGDQSAETELAELHSENMLRTIRRRVSCKEWALDLLHDALLAAILALRARTLEEPKKLENFLVRTAKYTAANYGRCKNQEMISQASDDIDSLASGLSPSVVYGRFRQRELLERTISSLSAHRDRQVAERFYLREESKAAICIELNLTAANFDSINHRIKHRIRQRAQRAIRLLDATTESARAS